MAEAAALEAAALRAGYRLTLLPGADDTTPLVVLCGWYGCQDKHLTKYSQLVNKMGAHTLRVQMPPATVFSLFPGPRRAFAERLLAFLRSPGVLPPSRPLLFYFFSNGGAFVHEQLCAALQAEPARHAAVIAAAAGCCFDSAPAAIRTGGAAYLFSQMSPVAALQPLLRLFFLGLVRFFGLLGGRFAACVGQQRADAFWAAMANAPTRGGQPETYIFSDDDPLCDAEELAALAAARQRAGVAVSTCRSAVSEHVGHLRCHPAEYEAALAAWLKAAGAHAAKARAAGGGGRP